MEIEKFSYDNGIVRNFAYATMLWGIVGFLVGIIIASQLAFPEFFNDHLGIKQLTFGRLRPLHTNAVIFAFVGNAIFMGVYYSLQRLLKARMFSDLLSKINFWGWQLIIVGAALTLPMGYTTSKEYAELEWPFDIAIALIWVVFGVNMIGTMIKRRVSHLYVAIWFYIATFVTVAMLHIFNSFEIPVSFMKSYSWYSGVQDALVQWWYGHNAVAFFLTTPFLGLMYYFVPKAANRPVYSYRLSIIHFWALIFLYIWAGPHHLLYTALPDWAQSLGVVFSVMLIAPSWGGMLNGLLTLRGAWDRVRDDVTLKFMVVALTAYGMSTFEGPMLSLKNVNMLAHYTDWIVAHVHVGGLGWNGFMTFGMLYYLIPRMFRTELKYKGMANFHFWIGTLGIVLYAVPMYVAGWMQGLMWRQFTAEGTLEYGNFLDTVTALQPYYILRVLGGVLFLIGAIAMTWNLIATIRQGSFLKNEETEAAPLAKHKSKKSEYWHKAIERKPMKMLVLSLVVVAIGGIIQIIPTIFVKSNIQPVVDADGNNVIQPYTPLELIGRDIYISEGCNNCHSQMIRPLRFETERYGEYSKAGEYIYDHPFLWGSKRTGPDLAREGGLRSNAWHYQHMLSPKDISPGSLMPAYPWMAEDALDLEHLEGKISAMRTLGVPYPEGYEKQALGDLKTQAKAIAADILGDLKKGGYSEADVEKMHLTEVIAITAYLQRLGTDIKAVSKPAAEEQAATNE
jgi:cytochrome c oxidase cbb3-type subunit I/II